MNFSFNFREMDNRSILVFGGLAIFIVAVLAYFLLIGPLFERLDQSAEERDAKEAQLAQLSAEVQDLERVQQNAGRLEQQLLDLNRRVPEQPEIPTLLVQIQEIAESSGVTQLLSEPGTPGPPEGGGPYSIVPITMTFEGTYEDLQDFLLRSNDLARLMAINNVSYEPIELEEGEDLADLGVERLLRVEIEAEVYFQPEDIGEMEDEAPVSPAPADTQDAQDTETTTEEDTGDQ